MKTIKISSRTDQEGYLRMSYPLNQKDKDVKVIILLDESSEDDEESLWLNSVAQNPAFDFLRASEEDIYTLNDGEPIDD